MGKALYRKYRSKNLSEIIGQDHITTALSNALKSDTISHAYLFTGPRGVGKTSIARILAHEVNQFNYDEDATNLDIIEIDAASNRRIDEIRELRERVHTAPTSGKYKVYIIDEVHMLTKEAFNALLKTLEEPPAHVIFILATTEAHKLPETIISRTQRYTFKPVQTNAAVDHLKTLAKSEKIDISDSALELIAKHGGGSFRDSISLLDQASTMQKKIEIEDVLDMLGIAADQMIEDAVAILGKGTAKELIEFLQSIQQNGVLPQKFAAQLSAKLRAEAVNGNRFLPTEQLTKLLNDLLNVSASSDPSVALQIALLAIVMQREPEVQVAAPTAAISAPTAAAHTPAPKSTPTPTKVPKLAPKSTPPAPAAQQDNEELLPTPASKAPAVQSDFTLQIWHDALENIRTKYNTLYGVARMAIAEVDGEELTLTFKFPFHQKRINEAKNKQILIDTIFGLTGKSPTIICIVDKNKTSSGDTNAQPEASSKPTANGIDAISNIFGSAEVIE